MAAVVMLGWLVAFAGGIWLVVVAFKESVLWGLGTLFVPFVGLAFAITHWQAAKTPFLINVVGVVIAMGAAVAAGMTGMPEAGMELGLRAIAEATAIG